MKKIAYEIAIVSICLFTSIRKSTVSSPIFADLVIFAIAWIGKKVNDAKIINEISAIIVFIAILIFMTICS